MKRAIFAVFAGACLICYGLYGIARSEVVMTLTTPGVSKANTVNVVGETDIFELDSNGDTMPTTSGTVDPFFEVTAVGTTGDIMPKDTGWQQDSNGDLQLIN